MKKLLSAAAVLIACAGVLLLPTQAQARRAAEETDTLMTDHKVLELGDKYVAVLSSMYQEEATRAGTLGYQSQLQERDAQSQMSRKQTMISLQDALDRINPKKLSADTRVDYYVLKELVGDKLFNITTGDELTKNPVWYLGAVDAIYDVLLKDYASPSDRQRDALKRVQALPAILEQGKTNIDNPPDLFLRIAIDKAQLAYASFNNVNFMLTKLTVDNYNKEVVKKACTTAQEAIKDYADFLKNLMLTKEYVDFRLGADNFEELFDEVYQQDVNLNKLKRNLDKELENSTKTLIRVISPTVEPLLTEDEKADRTDKKGLIQIFPQDYYKAIATFTDAPEEKDLLDTYADLFKKATVFFADNKIFPAGALQVVIAPAPRYLDNKLSTVSYLPPFPLLNKQMGDVLVTLPPEDDKQALTANFNYGKIRFNVLEYITPGENLMHSVATEEGRVLRKISHDPFFANGWVKYALNLAAETKFFNSAEDKINLAWFNYTKALLAVAEYNMQVGNANYTQTVDYLIENGLSKEEAEANVDHMALHPAHAIAYIVGEQAFNALRAKYAKKINKKLSLAAYHEKLLSLGRVPMIVLDEAMAKQLEEKKADSLFNMTYF